MLDMKDINTHLISCGFTKTANNKWTLKESKFALPNTHAQFINHDSEYQYSTIRKLK